MAFMSRAPMAVSLSPTRSAVPSWVVNLRPATMVGDLVNMNNERCMSPLLFPTVFAYRCCINGGGN